MTAIYNSPSPSAVHTSAVHPLEPLSANEILSAIAILKAEKGL
jgi:Cu2+-containing amine oxidase